ncbi:hypothetical protein CEXT_473361 [Caerostris extrusa]|uniref:Uncharacterized protein n=1 Tax=Caerostris extrusa TaxID=172846 RepID=A0AAV4VDE6_CAEEX|nr:hypothetical protein CEXT_473361 [Caerostris extrusa]
MIDTSRKARKTNLIHRELMIEKKKTFPLQKKKTNFPKPTVFRRVSVTGPDDISRYCTPFLLISAIDLYRDLKESSMPNKPNMRENSLLGMMRVRLIWGW